MLFRSGSATANLTVTGGTGADTINATTLGEAVTINAGAGADIIYVGAGMDTVILDTVAAGGIDEIHNLALGDSISFFNSTHYVDLSLADFSLAATLTDALAAVADTVKTTDVSSTVSWAAGFVYEGDHYVYIDGGNDLYDAANDAVVKLVGTDLSALTSATFTA